MTSRSSSPAGKPGKSPEPLDADRLARAAATGDRDAFAALCEALQPDIWRYCLVLTGDRELAREAAQETFLRAVTAIDGYRGDGPVRVWLLVIARRAVAATLRRERGRPETLVAEPPEQLTSDAAAASDLAALVGSLPLQLAQPFVLTQVIGLSYEQTARVCGCRVGTVRSRVFRARDRLVSQWWADAAGEAAS